MPSRFRFAFVAVVLIGCAPGIVLHEPTPVLVTAQPPAPKPVPPAPVIREQIVVREAIQFDTNRDTIKSESLHVLDEISELIKKHPELVKIRVEGHTDTVGTKDENLSLSKRRAIAVRTYLIQRGIDASRLIAEGYGGDNPVAPNTTTDGRARNRRVAFTILDRTDGGEVYAKVGDS